MDTNSEIFDAFDIDLVIKVLSNTAFSPFFTFFIPVFYVFQGLPWSHPTVIGFGAWSAACSLFWGIKWYSRLYRNQSSLLFGPPPLDWGEQIVVVTGGASGVGELLANTLAVRNVTVVVLDINPIQTDNHNIEYYKCDVSKWEEVEAVAKRIVEDIGHPTILVNNAGVVQGKLLLDLTPDDIKQTFNVNTLAHYWTLKAFLPDMIKNNHGHIVTMSSVTGLIGACQVSDYSASKAALFSLHESLRYELDKRYNAPNVRTTLVVPGHINTPLFSRVNWPRWRLFRFLAPSLQPITVVKAVITALDETHSRTLFMPFYANFVALARLFPSFLRDLAQWLAAADTFMEGFVKVSGRRPEEGSVSPSLKNDRTSSRDD